MQKLNDYFDEMGIETFWYRAKKKKPSENSLNADLSTLKEIVSNCTKCELHKSRDKTVFGSGNESARILFIGEAPGRDEDKEGEPFVGRAGKLLTEMISSINLNREDIYITNTVKCRPPSNRNPSDEEVKSCADYLENQIELIKPKIIILLGKVAANRIIKNDQPIAELRKKTFFFEPKNIPIIVFYHPAYLLRNPKDKRKVWEDLLYLKSVMKEYDC
ncbi:MAG: uracil-DNA glycosylase [Gammaproteobacteria bacterium]|nr:uracil-DNA glycosylase [Gammaproteobacteria bacterium]